MDTRTRQLIYGLLAAALLVLIAVGAVRQEQADAITKLVTVALDVATAAMMIVAARHVTPATTRSPISRFRVTTTPELGALTVVRSSCNWA